jgi:hypothetical protein
MARDVILFVAGAVKTDHGGDLAASEFVRLLSTRYRVIVLGPRTDRSLLPRSLEHFARILRLTRYIQQTGRGCVVCINHPKYLASTFLFRPILIYHGIIKLRHLEQTLTGASRFVVTALQRLATSFLWAAHRQILAIGGSVSEFPRTLRLSRKIVQVNNPMLEVGEPVPPAATSCTSDDIARASGRLLFVGRFADVKRLLPLVDFFVRHDLADRLMVIGSGPDEDSAKAIANGTSLAFATSKSAVQVRELFAVSKGFVTFSKSDTFCRPVFEAASVGKPTLAPMWPGADGWLTDRSFVSFLDATGSEADMADQIRGHLLARFHEASIRSDCIAFCRAGQEAVLQAIADAPGFNRRPRGERGT